MKTSLLLLYCIIVQVSFGQMPMWISDPLIVADGFGNHHPQIEITGDNYPAITWTSSATASVYFAKMNELEVFDTPIKLNPEGVDVWSYSWSGPDFIVEGSSIYVVFKSSSGPCYLVKSTDNGTTFGDTVRISSAATFDPSFPDVAVFNDTVYATFMNHMDVGEAVPNYVLVRSVDGGATFEEYVLASDVFTDEVCDCCPPEIIVNEDLVVIYFRNNDANIRDIKALVSIDRGLSFSSMVEVDEHLWYLLSCPSTGPDARFLVGNQAVSVYKTFEDGESKISASIIDHDSGEILETQEVSATTGSGLSRNYPQIATGNSSVGVVWEEVGEGTSIDVFFNSNYSPTVAFNPDFAINLTQQAGVQSKPDITMTDWDYHVVYADATDGNLYYLLLHEFGEIDESATEENFSAYPSPFNNEFKLTVSKLTKVSIIDLSGNKMFESTLSTSTLIQTADWPAGVYLILYETEQGQVYQKVVKH